MRKIFKKYGKKLPWLLANIKSRFDVKKKPKDENKKPNSLIELSQDTTLLPDIPKPGTKKVKFVVMG